MPGMPRLDKKSTKIAYDILGVPANLRREKKSETERRIEKRLVFEETTRVK